MVPFKTHLLLEEYFCLKSAIRNDVFTPLQIITFARRFIELTVTLPDICSDATEFQPSFVQEYIDKCFQKLERMMNSRNELVRREAKLTLARVKLLLKTNMDEAIKFHMSLMKDLKDCRGEREILFGLGKCYIIKAEELELDGEAMILWEKALGLALPYQNLMMMKAFPINCTLMFT